MMALDDIPTFHEIWLGNSGASHHTTHDMKNCLCFTQLDKPFKIQQVQGVVHVTHGGTVDLITDSETGPRPLRLHGVLYIHR